MCKELSKKDIKNIMKDIPKIIIIHDIIEYEKFKQIKINGTFSPYLISSCGRIFSINNKHKKAHELKTRTRNDGYVDIRITYKSIKYNFLIHILVALYFVKNKNITKNIVVNHKDGIKSNNGYWNLEWTTHSENTIHAINHGLFNHVKGDKVKSSKYTENEIIEVCELILQNFSLKDISLITNKPYSFITNILYKRTWKDITEKYDFSNYGYGKDIKSINDNKNQIYQLCNLASNNDYSILELSKMTGINRRTIYDILKGKTHKNISSKFDLSKYRK